jgi:uncharacterized membrane protein YphA (DoxX/SURF4 family)
MGEVAYVTALGLAVVFAWAGAVKLARPAETAATFRALRLPAPRALARAVPAAELLLALLLVAAPRVGAVAALGMLAVFTAVLLQRLRQGSQVSCGCFGSARTAPLSATDLVRNALLAGIAALALVAPGAVVPSLPAVLTATTGLALTALVLALTDVRVQTGRLLDNHVPAGPEGLA